MHQTTRLPRIKNKTARTPLDMDISALLRSAQLLESAASGLNDMDHDTDAAEELTEALRHNRQIWSVFMGDARRTGSHLAETIQQNVPTLGSQVMAQTRTLESEKSTKNVRRLVDVNRKLASDLQRSKAA